MKTRQSFARDNYIRERREAAKQGKTNCQAKQPNLHRKGITPLIQPLSIRSSMTLYDNNSSSSR